MKNNARTVSTSINTLRVVAVMIVILSLSFCANPFGSSTRDRSSGGGASSDPDPSESVTVGSVLDFSGAIDELSADSGVTIDALGFVGTTSAFRLIDDFDNGVVLEAGGTEWASAVSPRFAVQSVLAEPGFVTEISFDFRAVSDVSRPENNRMGVALLHDNGSAARLEMSTTLGIEFAPVTGASDRSLQNARVNAPSLGAQRRKALQTSPGNLIVNGGSAPWLRITVRITESEVTVLGVYPGAGAIGAWTNTVVFDAEDGQTNAGSFNRIELTHRGGSGNQYQLRDLGIAVVAVD